MATLMSSRTGAMDVYAELDRADRAEQNVEQLRRKLDAERGLTASLRSELRAANSAMQQAVSQARALHGAPGVDTSSASVNSLIGLKRMVESLRHRLDVEKKGSNRLQAQCVHLSGLVENMTKERKIICAAHEQMRLELQRKTAELERVHVQLRDSVQLDNDERILDNFI